MMYVTFLERLNIVCLEAEIVSDCLILGDVSARDLGVQEGVQLLLYTGVNIKQKNSVLV